MDAPGHAHDDRSVQFLNFLWRNNTFLVHETSAQFYCSSMGKKKLSVHETTAPFLSLQGMEQMKHLLSFLPFLGERYILKYMKHRLNFFEFPRGRRNF